MNSPRVLTIQAWRLAIQSLLYVILFLAYSPAVYGEAVPKIQVEVSKNVDERLFLLRVIDVMYEQFPTGIQDRNELTQAIANSRSQAKRLEMHIRNNNLGSELAGVYADYSGVLDAYVELLVEINRIQSGVVDRTTTSAFKSGFSSGVEGAGVYSAATRAGVDSSDATLAALLVAGGRFLVKQYEDGKAIESEKRETIRKVQRVYESKVETALARLQEVAASLATKCNWNRGETGLLMSQPEASHLRQVMGGDDERLILRMLEDLIVIRPRDPFVRNLRNLTVSTSDNSNAQVCLRAARDSVYAASLVPKGGVYDEYRASCLYLAAIMAQAGRGKEVIANKSVGESTEISRYFVAASDAAFEYSASDLTGELRARRAWARMSNGDLDEALTLANNVFELQKDQVEFCYQYACLLSRLDRNLDRSMAWLKKSVQLGFYEIAHARRDPDLANLRRKRSEEFEALTQVNFEWSINYGILNDDIIVVNKSAFPITNVKLKVQIEKAQKTWNPRLEAEEISPGQSYKWENVISIPGSSCDKATANLTCDQNQ